MDEGVDNPVEIVDSRRIAVRRKGYELAFRAKKAASAVWP
jgi:hypothetical protein